MTKIIKKSVTQKIFLLIFKKQEMLASTFLRFQEYYESPKFKGRIFRLEEYKKWYIKNSPQGQQTGKFTYYSDWNGFNIPSVVLKPFYEGKFNPLSQSEKELLKMFQNKKEKFYIIGIHREKKNTEKTGSYEKVSNPIHKF